MENIPITKAKQDEAFLNLAIHDLKAPLRAVKNYSEWVSEDCAGKLPPESTDHLKKICERVERMEWLLADVSLLCEIDQLQLNPIDLDASLVATEIVGTFRARYPSIQFETSNEPCKAVANRWALEWIFSCLVSNASKHRQGNTGRVRVHCFHNSFSLRITVCDDGEGIDEQYFAKIFEPFSTLKSKDEVEGSGLGLAILDRLVSRLGGQIDLRSTAGSGSEFIVEIP